MLQNVCKLLVDSWQRNDGTETIDSILSWVQKRNETLHVEINKVSLDECDDWHYDCSDGTIHNKNRSFFSIAGMKSVSGSNVVEQPVLLQKEIGYLGFICKPINGVLHFLVQAKIEPGNVNTIQLSPTIQATKSNFTQKHGGKKPMYLRYFINANKDNILVDQIQSEQSSRFLKKRNRNIIIVFDEDEKIECKPSHKWLTLGQIKALMHYPNLVNMDTRTVLSCIPYALLDRNDVNCEDNPVLLSVFSLPEREKIVEMFHSVNNMKMFESRENEIVDLYSLSDWEMKDGEYVCKKPYPMKVIFCDISIEEREVSHWCQPLFEATGKALFCLLCADVDGKREFLVRLTPEIGCFDTVEIGPTLQREAVYSGDEDEVSRLIFSKIANKDSIIFDSVLSEEGGRFYHEENRNIIIKIDKDEIKDLPSGYFWCNFATLNSLNMVNNCLNIQLRNLMSLLEI